MLSTRRDVICALLVACSPHASPSRPATTPAPHVERAIPTVTDATPTREPEIAPTPDIAATLASIVEDPPPSRLLSIHEQDNDTHYMSGDEELLQLFRPSASQRGGLYLGVGSDQAYLLIGWARSQAALLIDYDSRVVKLHKIYRALFLGLATPDEFYAAWDSSRAAETLALIRGSLRDDPDLLTCVWIFKRYRPEIRRRMTRLRLVVGSPSFVMDQGDYDHVRGLYREDKIRALSANLLAENGAVEAIGAASHALNLPVRILYLSNAEEYWPYGPRFRANMQSLLADDRSLVLRTLSSGPINKDYVYNAQKLTDYQRLLQMDFIHSVFTLRPRLPTAPPFFVMSTRDPEDVKAQHDRDAH